MLFLLLLVFVKEHSLSVYTPNLRIRVLSQWILMLRMSDFVQIFFFFQAEDGIRDHCVTGVQTCALPISVGLSRERLGEPPPRLRPRCSGALARAGSLAAGGRDRDHALPPRPLGRPRAVGVGIDVPPGARRRAQIGRAHV